MTLFYINEKLCIEWSRYFKNIEVNTFVGRLKVGVKISAKSPGMMNPFQNYSNALDIQNFFKHPLDIWHLQQGEKPNDLTWHSKWLEETTLVCCSITLNSFCSQEFVEGFQTVGIISWIARDCWQLESFIVESRCVSWTRHIRRCWWKRRLLYSVVHWC